MSCCTRSRRPRLLVSHKAAFWRAWQDLIEWGYVESAGEFRNGKPVYRITDLGRAWFEREEGKLS
jgi:DNA-binding PadR family transcriptional regulator